MRAHLWDDKSMDTPVLYVRQNNFWEVIMSWPTILEIRMTRSRSCSTKKCCWEIILHLSRIWAQFGSGSCMLSIFKKIKNSLKTMFVFILTPFTYHYSYFTFVDPDSDPYSKYRFGSTKLLETDPNLDPDRQH